MLKSLFERAYLWKYQSVFKTNFWIWYPNFLGKLEEGAYRLFLSQYSIDHLF